MSGPYVLQVVGASGPVPPYNSKEKKKMGWFKRWIMRMTQEAIEEDRQTRHSIVAAFPSQTRGFDANNGLNMSVYPADGGYVIQFNHYDHKIDRNFQSLHIIGNDEDFADRISQIITLELIKNGKTH
jgi:hypothetical protein